MAGMNDILSVQRRKRGSKAKSSTLNAFVTSELIICHSFLQRHMIKAALTEYPSFCKPLYYLKKGTRNLLFSSAYRWSYWAFAFCWLELFQHYKCLFGRAFQLTLDYSKSCQNRQCKTIAPSLSSTRELLLPQDLDWTTVFAAFLSRCPSDTDNQIYSKSKTKI